MMPFFFLAMYEKDGFPAEKVLYFMIRQKFLVCGIRPYQIENMYQKLGGKTMDNYININNQKIGMTEEQLTHVTEPFYRVDRARSRREGGTGLGLALCATIAQAHGAELTFTSVPGKGTKVFLKL